MAAELLTLVVRPGLRGRGVGTRLINAVEERFTREGRNDRVIGVVPANARAAALYSGRGYVPTWLTLTRFGRPPTAAPAGAPCEITALPHDEVDRLAPLWHELHRHHQLVAPALAPFVSHEASWAVGRELLEAAAEGGVLVCAGPRESPSASSARRSAATIRSGAIRWATGREVAEKRERSSSATMLAGGASDQRCSTRSTSDSPRPASPIRRSARWPRTPLRSTSASGGASGPRGSR